MDTEEDFVPQDNEYAAPDEHVGDDEKGLSVTVVLSSGDSYSSVLKSADLKYLLHFLTHNPNHFIDMIDKKGDCTVYINTSEVVSVVVEH